jgi:hypothetical protein
VNCEAIFGFGTSNAAVFLDGQSSDKAGDV